MFSCFFNFLSFRFFVFFPDFQILIFFYFKVWLFGYSENHTPLTGTEIFQDISEDHAKKTGKLKKKKRSEKEGNRKRREKKKKKKKAKAKRKESKKT